jgi:hypothetical protein
MEYLVGVILGLLGLLFLERSKKKSAEGTLENLETRKETLELDKKTTKNTGLIEAEETKREEIKNDQDKKSLSEIARFLNDRK